MRLNKTIVIVLFLLVACVAVIADVAVKAAASSTPASLVPRLIPSPIPTARHGTCAKATGPFTEKGIQVLQTNGKAYVPYGITVPGLAHQDYQQYTTDDNAQIVAAAQFWCANTIRLQVAQDNLVGSSGTLSAPDFLRALKSEVSLAENHGLVVVINAQTQDVGLERGPTTATRMFWKELSKVYGNDPQVIFDMFNEPRVGTGNETQTWQIWQRGGTYQGVTYLGMQDLVNEVRADGARNLLWVEGPHTANTLAEVSSYPITGGPLMYAIHHPKGAHNPAVWESDFGYLITKKIAPVVVGEWTNYASSKNECWPDAPTAVPAFLTYLQERGIGMTVWMFKRGVMIESNDLSDPTFIQSNHWACRDGLDQGAGHQVMDWYWRQNAQS